MIKEDYSVKDQAVYCKLGVDAWHKVIYYNDTELSVLDTASCFSEIWNQKEQNQDDRLTEIITKSWQELLLPFPDFPITCWAYAFTYDQHRKETGLEESFRFHKAGPAYNMSSSIGYRPYLDYEAEIGILMNKYESNRFGYVMVNDLTDRGIQARTFNREKPAPGFSEAKSFYGSLRVGPLLLIGDEAIWNKTEITLLLNSEIRQQIYGRECLMKPGQFHQETFSTGEEKDWILVASGTSAGVIFHAPNKLEKLMLFARSGFKKKNAIEKWLSELHFLKTGDEIEFRSPLLGIGKAKVNNEQ
jgi:2-keto-4-pentenoate hydratase/2-oxohepta-3-ene-1,7-dioic acid hydratase in catechol pathway